MGLNIRTGFGFDVRYWKIDETAQTVSFGAKTEYPVTDPAAAGTAPAAAGVESAAQNAAPVLRTEAPAGTDPTADGEPARLVSGRRYVVLGVFSTPENAARAAQLARDKEGSFRCGVYRFGAKFMVSPFESEDAEACTLFIRAHAETFPGMWTYTAR